MCQKEIKLIPTPSRVTPSVKAPLVGTAKLQNGLNLQKYLNARADWGNQEDAADIGKQAEIDRQVTELQRQKEELKDNAKNRKTVLTEEATRICILIKDAETGQHPPPSQKTVVPPVLINPHIPSHSMILYEF